MEFWLGSEKQTIEKDRKKWMTKINNYLKLKQQKSNKVLSKNLKKKTQKDKERVKKKKEKTQPEWTTMK